MQLYSRHYGEGSTKAKTVVVDNVVVCAMRGSFTEASIFVLEPQSEDPIAA